METYFVNEAFQKAIEDYLKSKNNKESILYNSFLVVVIRILINIYGELDIINPYKIRREEALNTNLMKYGASKTDINNLKRLIDGFYKIDIRNEKMLKKEENIYFIEVQKCLIDLFTLKRVKYGVKDIEQKEFFDLLYTPGAPNELRIAYNYANANNQYEIAEYYNEKLKIKSEIKEEKEEKELLGFDVYKMFNITVADLSKMDNNSVKNLNKQIYEAFDINDKSMNKEFLLSEKIKEIKMQNNKITSGNGYVDILLIMSVIVTSIMIITIAFLAI